MQPGQADGEIGGAVAIGIAFDPGQVACDVLLKAQLSGGVPEQSGSDEGEQIVNPAGDRLAYDAP